MNTHRCLICLGSNDGYTARMKAACTALRLWFPDIRFAPERITQAIGDRFLSPFANRVAEFYSPLPAEEIRHVLKQIEKDNGRAPEDKERGIVKMDIDLLMYDETILKPNDMMRDYVQESIQELH